MTDIVKHVVAHYRLMPRTAMRGLTFAQMLIMFDAMVKLHVLTNPFGSGEGGGSRSGPQDVDGVTGAQILGDAGIFPVRRADKSTLDPAIQAYLNEGG